MHRIGPPERPVKRVIVLLLLVLSACTPAHATGVALRWNSCEGSANRNFACDRSTGSELLVGSVQAPDRKSTRLNSSHRT